MLGVDGELSESEAIVGRSQLRGYLEGMGGWRGDARTRPQLGKENTEIRWALGIEAKIGMQEY